ncbi:MAG: hypothetical protein M3Q36_01585 [bacterium]|nr:hypothetical protein [bacterium]
MSFEHSPEAGVDLQELARKAELALAAETWYKDGTPVEDLQQYPSMQLCMDLQREFEARYHVLSQPDVIYSPDIPPYLTTTKLLNPFLYLPEACSDGGDLRVTLSGEVPVDYLTIAMQGSMGLDGNEYNGPHFFGMLDTRILDLERFPLLGIRDGIYQFITPFVDVQVGGNYVPRILN